MNADPGAARDTLRSAVARHDVDLSGVVAAADTVSRRSDGSDDRLLIARALRSAVARGLDENETDRADVLATYAKLAARFRSWIDVWNAASLAARSGVTDAELRALRTVAFVNVFDGVARRRPELVRALIGDTPDARFSTFVLLRWLEKIADTTIADANTVDVAESLHAVAICRDAWAHDAPVREVDLAWSDLAVNLARSAPEPIAQTKAWSFVMTRATRAMAERLNDATRADEAVERVTSAEGTAVPESNSSFSHEDMGTDDISDRVARTRAEEIELHRRRIWVVGAHAARHQLEGVAKALGFTKPGQVFAFMSYDDVVSKSLPAAIDPARDVGVILGAVPHSARDVGAHSSLATALVADFGLDVVPVRKNSTSRELTKITKTAFRRALRRLLASTTPTVIDANAA